MEQYVQRVHTVGGVQTVQGVHTVRGVDTVQGVHAVRGASNAVWRGSAPVPPLLTVSVHQRDQASDF